MNNKELLSCYKLNDSQIEKFDIFANFLIEENNKYNLTSIVDLDSIYEKHFFDSLSVLNDYDLKGSLCDVGSGGGFPGIPLAIANRNLKLTFLDSNNKKIAFLKESCKKCELEANFIVGRAEECNTKFDNVIARGVASLPILLELCSNLINENGLFISMKGSNYKEELEASKNAIEILGYKLLAVKEYTLPNEKSMHCNLYFKKIKSHPNKYPRQFGQIKKKPL